MIIADVYIVLYEVYARTKYKGYSNVSKSKLRGMLYAEMKEHEKTELELVSTKLIAQGQISYLLNMVERLAAGESIEGLTPPKGLKLRLQPNDTQEHLSSTVKSHSQ
ncbi:MAG: hypothetical protein ACTSPB_25090 [Candidatus Thorarchaeota archaeon]